MQQVDQARDKLYHHLDLFYRIGLLFLLNLGRIEVSYLHCHFFQAYKRAGVHKKEVSSLFLDPLQHYEFEFFRHLYF